MGKRKSARKAVVKKREKLDVQFDCPFCNESKSTEYRADKKAAVGTIYCRVCFASFSQSINGLSEAIDVYSGWIEQIESNTQDTQQRQHFDEPPQEDEEELIDGDDLFGDLEDEGVMSYTNASRNKDYAADSPKATEDALFGDDSDSEPQQGKDHSDIDSVDGYLSDLPSKSVKKSRLQSDESDSDQDQYPRTQRKNALIDSDEE
ncbi:Transcription elongation factor 1 [Entomophthora muscae]|uniref:Transcription elongation factor 1 n=2 Tax=Entomophthora muscae TaxID=34485 RepID=A0ACC2UH42_9FUNG|nr:Transcription elongation factor 1 [Entomophthora muscae]KAJ9086055.1 Transcription elongation factor 1 [Entomophthora muscae]